METKGNRPKQTRRKTEKRDSSSELRTIGADVQSPRPHSEHARGIEAPPERPAAIAVASRAQVTARPAFSLHSYGQTVWLDEISVELLRSGAFHSLVEEHGVRGVTANPTIFAKAIATGNDYDGAIHQLTEEGLSAGAIFERLEVQDLAHAATILRPVYNSSLGDDGFVSIEVSPALAYDTEATIEEARRLWAALDRLNVLVKVPATRAGLPAIEALLAEGININITLLFSIARYEQVMEAYLAGLERRLAAGDGIEQIRSVASFFVSRVDTLVNRQLDQRAETAPAAEQELLRDLRSRAAVANAKLAYRRFRETFQGSRWEVLRAQGAALQRPLWASTSTKDPSLPDTYYVNALIGPSTVTTMPAQTLLAFDDHGTVAPTLEAGTAEAEAVLGQLRDAGIDLDQVTERLEAEGVKSFVDSYAAALAHIQQKMGGE